MIFEMSRTFPRNDVGLKKEMDQLFEYDMDIPVFNGKEYINVDSYDIILLLGIKDSLEIANRISKYMERENKKFKHNFIVMEYISNYMDKNANYCFRKIPLIKSSFTDFFPDDLSLSKQIDESYKSITVKIEHMQEYKINGVLCNDDPPPAYLAAYIWHKIMYSYMNEGQKKIWREKNPNFVIPIEVNVEDLKYRIEKSIRNGRLRIDWVKNVLEFLISVIWLKGNPAISTKSDTGIFIPK